MAEKLWRNMFLLLVFCFLGNSAKAAEFTYQNPNEQLELRDTDILSDDGMFYAVGTCKPFWGEPNPGVKLFSSPDLKNWTFVKLLIDAEKLDEDVWYKDRFWAPELCKIQDRYYLTFNCQNNPGTYKDVNKMKHPHGCGLAVADSITGPYTVLTHEKPLASFPANDVHLFEDEDGKTYAFFNNGWTPVHKIFVARIDLEKGRLMEEPVELISQEPGEWDSGGMEGSHVVKHDGVYYLFYSSWTRGYAVGYATATNIYGPYKKYEKNPLFGAWNKNGEKIRLYEGQEVKQEGFPYKNAGHNQFFIGPDGRLWTSLHGYTDSGNPALIIDSVWFEDGVVKTNAPTYTLQTVTIAPEMARKFPGLLETGTGGHDLQGINLVLNADCADPTILRDGDTFYMTYSSYNYLPGLPIWQSKDLKHWSRLTYALQTKVRGAVWAPDLIKHEGKYYIFFPAGSTNYVITADNIAGPWSSPVDLKLKGIDPGHIAAPDGKRYLYVNQGFVVSLSDDGQQVTSERKDVYDGWRYPREWVTEGFYDESPKLNYHNGWYYLTTAQGGTAGPPTSHMVVSARSRSPLGPWRISPHNPIIRTWSADERWWSKGHGTIFDDTAGNWYIVYHAYEQNRRPLGRQVLMEPIEWTEDGWFKTVRDKKIEGPTTSFGNVQIESDRFSTKPLNLQWQFMNIASLDVIGWQDGKIVLPVTPGQIRAMHTLACDHNYEAAIDLEVDGDVAAGFGVFYNPRNYAGLLVDRDGLFWVKDGRKDELITVDKIKSLKFRLVDYNLSVSFSKDGVDYTEWEGAFDVSHYHHNRLRGFSSLKPGVFGRGEGKIILDNFTYKALSGSR